jgi:EmrB/QacA subfamily drug resistance transporter
VAQATGVTPSGSAERAADPEAPRTAAPPATRTRPEATPAPEAPPAAPAKWGLPLAVVVVGMFMAVLDTSIVNVAIPTMQGQFGASPDDIEWISTAYTLCLGVVVPTSAWLGERLGLRRIYLLSLVSFSIFSALCGTANDLTTMIVYRILQAIPGGVIQVTCLTILYRIVPPEKRGTAMGLYGLGIVFAPGVGPTLGGYLVDYVDWRLIFFINLPIGLLGAVAALMVLPNFPATPGRSFDVPGFVCIASACFALLLAVSEGTQWGWTSYPILLLLFAGVDFLALFVIIELQVDEPLLNVRALRYLPFVNAIALLGITYTGMFATVYVAPLFLQSVQNITAWNTGLVVMPMALAMAMLTPISGRLFDKIGARWLVSTGMLINGGAALLLTRINIDLPRPEFIVLLMVFAAGMSLCMMPVMTAGMSALPPDIVSDGSAINTLTQRVVAAIGLAGVNALNTIQKAQLFADRTAMTTPTGATENPQVVQLQSQGPSGLIPLFKELTAQVASQVYSNTFLIIGVVVLVTSPLAFLLPKARPSGSTTAMID